MDRGFAQTMSILRRERGYSQRKVATDLGISQALLSHYENAAREPGLEFICKACLYYGVSADYMLGLSDQEGSDRNMEDLCILADQLKQLSDGMQAKVHSMQRGKSL